MNHLEVVENINKIYGGVFSSSKVLSTVLDFCLDQHLMLDYSQVRLICYSVARRNSVMPPTNKGIKKLVEILNEEVKNEQA